MTESITVYQQIKQFVNKFNSDELDFIKNPNDEQQSIITHLANAVNSFEMAERERDLRQAGLKLGLKEFSPSYSERVTNYNIDTTISNLNRWIKIAKLNNIYTDYMLKKEIAEFKIEKDHIQTKINELQVQNKKLVEENIKFRKGLKKLFDENEGMEERYGWLLEHLGTVEGKVEEK